MTRWGAGDTLALALIDRYVGHVYDAFQGLKALTTKGKNCRGRDGHMELSVRQCFLWNRDVEVMKGLLRQLAEQGYVPLNCGNDAAAAIISENNVGRVAIDGGSTTLVGLSPEFFEKYGYFLVHSKQSMRLAIASVLKRIERYVQFAVI